MTRTPDPRITKASLEFRKSVGFLPFLGRIGRSICAYPRQPQTGLSAPQSVFLLKALWSNENRKCDLRWTCKPPPSDIVGDGLLMPIAALFHRARDAREDAYADAEPCEIVGRSRHRQ